MISLHSAEELRQLSTLFHWAVGYIFLGVALFALLERVPAIKNKSIRLIWPILIFIAGLLLVPYLLVHHGWDKVGTTWSSIIADPQQTQHFVMGLLLLAASTIELFHRLNKLTAMVYGLAFPIALLLIGYMFLIHPQHGTTEAMAWSTQFHQLLGAAIITTSLLKAAEVIRPSNRWLAYAWLVPLVITSIMLVTYEEPGGAYHGTQNTIPSETETNLHHME